MEETQPSGKGAGAIAGRTFTLEKSPPQSVAVFVSAARAGRVALPLVVVLMHLRDFSLEETRPSGKGAGAIAGRTFTLEKESSAECRRRIIGALVPSSLPTHSKTKRVDLSGLSNLSGGSQICRPSSPRRKSNCNRMDDD